MRNIYLLVFLFASVHAYGQLAENFTDGDFTANPAWNGNTAHFTVNAAQELQLNNTVAGDSYLAVPLSYSSLDNLEWQILARQSVAGSAANFGRVYLASSRENLKGATDGYYLQLGENGNNDAIELFRQTETASVSVCRGTAAAIAVGFTARIKVTRNASGLWEVWADLTGGNNFLRQASGTDATHAASDYFGIRCKYTATNATKFYYDDISVGAMQTRNDDATPPAVDQVIFTNATRANVIFNEEVDEGANVASNYSVDAKTATTAVLQSDRKTITLTLTSPLANGSVYPVSVANVKDLAGNAMANYSAEVLYFQEAAAAFNDLVINEIFPDPAPPERLPEYEFLELYNRSEKAFNLKDWKISDGSTIGIFPSFIIRPKEYLIVTGASFVSAYSSYGKTVGVAFPSLNNSSDKIILTDKNERKIDTLNYSSSFYQNADKAHGGWTLERLNPDLNTNETSNWRASTDARGGTPGSVNSVFGINPDNQPPTLETLVVKNRNQLTVQFSEKITKWQFEADHGLGKPAVVVLEDGKTAELTFPDFENGVTCQLAVSAEDLAGNVFSGRKDFRYFQPVPVHYKDIIFTEVACDPSPPVNLPEAEYIEVYNRSAAPIDLGGWTLSDAAATIALSSLLIFPKEYAVLTSAANASKFSAKTLGVSHFPSLSNSGEPLALRKEGRLIDSVNYSIHWHKEADKKEGGWSLEIIDTENSCGEEDNWESSEDPNGGTPGKSNSVKGSNPDLTPPKLLSAFPQNDGVILTFNEKLNSTVAVGHFTLEPNTEITKAFFTDKTLRKVSLQTLLQKNTLYKATAQVRDCAGNEIQNDKTLTFALPDAAAKGEAVINEILFNPKTGGVDFVELYNNSSKFFNMKDWKIGNRSAAVKNFSEELFSPRSYKILTSDAAVLANHYPNTKSELIVSCRLPPLPDDIGSFLITDGQTVIDSIYYSDKQHHALLRDTQGVSLERNSFTDSSTDAGNWCSSSEGATPGYVNSCSRTSAVSDASVWVEPEVFAPELPGQDFARLHYKFERGGKAATVTVIDASGHEVNHLATNEILGNAGSFRWDGETNRGWKADHGCYFFWMEVVDLEGTVQVFRKRVVVSSR